MATDTHAEYPPSSLSLWDKCPSYLLPEDDEETNEAAESGTRCHAAMEAWAKGESDYLKQCEDEEEEKLVERCREEVVMFRGEFPANGFKDTPLRFVERTVGICDERTYGTVDFFEHWFRDQKAEVVKFDATGASPTNLKAEGNEQGKTVGGWKAEQRALLIDYKFGRIEVSAPRDNVQMMAYTLGVFESDPNIDSVLCVVIQPRVAQMSKTYLFTRVNDYRFLKVRIRQVLDRALQNEGKVFLPQSDVCAYCDRKADCPAIIQFAESASGYADLPKLEDCNTPDALATALNAARVLAAYADTVKKFAKEKMHEEGWDIPGWGITMRAPREYIHNYCGVQLALDHAEVPYDSAKLDQAFTISKTKLLEAIRAGSLETGEELKGKALNEAFEKSRQLLVDRGFISIPDGADPDGTVILREEKPET